MNKGGAGPHGWGSVADEFDNVRAGEQDATLAHYLDVDEEGEERDTVHFDTTTGTIIGVAVIEGGDSDTASIVDKAAGSGGGRRRSNSTMSTGSAGVTDSERAHARSFRTASFSGNRTDSECSCVSGDDSSEMPHSDVFHVLSQSTVDLASIARTSYAVSGSSPPVSPIDVRIHFSDFS